MPLNFPELRYGEKKNNAKYVCGFGLVFLFVTWIARSKYSKFVQFYVFRSLILEFASVDFFLQKSFFSDEWFVYVANTFFRQRCEFRISFWFASTSTANSIHTIAIHRFALRLVSYLRLVNAFFSPYVVYSYSFSWFGKLGYFKNVFFFHVSSWSKTLWWSCCFPSGYLWCVFFSLCSFFLQLFTFTIQLFFLSLCIFGFTWIFVFGFPFGT